MSQTSRSNVALPNVLNLRTSVLHEPKPPAPRSPLPAPLRRSAANPVACFSKRRRTLLPLLGGEGRGEVGRHTNSPSCFHSSNERPLRRSATVSQTSRSNVALPNVLNLRTSVLHEPKPPAPRSPLPAPLRRSAANPVACFSKSRRTLLPLLGGEGRGEVGRHTNSPSCFHSSNAPPVWRSATVSQTSRSIVASQKVGRAVRAH